MKSSSETKILLILLAIIIPAGVALFLTTRPPVPPKPPAPPKQVTAEAVDKLASGTTNVRGPQTAPLTVVEYADFQCDNCRIAHKSVVKRLEKADIPVRFAFRHYPITSIHARAIPAGVAAEAAGKQGKFWEMYDALFTLPQELTDAQMEGAAKKIGLDIARFKQDLKDPAAVKKINADQKEGEQAEVNSTPTFFFRDKNGKVTITVGEKDTTEKINQILADAGSKEAAKQVAAAPQTKGP